MTANPWFIEHSDHVIDGVISITMLGLMVRGILSYLAFAG
jgi:hypothetical protein